MFTFLAIFSQAQNLSLNKSTEGISSYKQPTSSNFNPKLQVSTSTLKSNTIQVSENGGAFKDFQTKALTNGWSITANPVYIQNMTGGSKQTFLKTKITENNTGMWVVRIVKAMSTTNELLNTSTNDSTLFPNVLVKTSNVVKEIPVHIINSGKPLQWHKTFTISNIEFETLFVDDEKINPFRNTSEFIGNLDFVIFNKTSSTSGNIIADNKGIFVKQSNQNSTSYVQMEIGKKYAPNNNNSLNFSIIQSQFSNIELRIRGSLTDLDPTKPTENSTTGLTKELLGNETKSFVGKLLSSCVYNKNFIDIKNGNYTFRVHFIISVVD